MTWETIDWIRSLTKLPIILKGVLNPDDALAALNHNISALIISNHGGRQIDHAIAPIDALGDIAEVMQNRIQLIVDGGIYSGERIFKALALGANAVMISRPIMWSLAINGQEQVEITLQTFQKELASTMRLAGCSSLEKIHEYGISLLGGQTLFLRKLEKLLSENKKLSPSIAKSFLSYR